MCRYNPALAPRADQLHLHAANAERTTVTDILNKSNALPPVSDQQYIDICFNYWILD